MLLAKRLLIAMAPLMTAVVPAAPAVAAGPVAAQPDPAALKAFKAAIRAKYDLKEQAFKNKDPVAIVDKFYTADVISVTPGPGAIQGRDALLQSYREHMNATVKIVSYKTHLNGNSGLDWTTFTATPDDAKQPPRSLKLLFLWEKRRGEWWCIGDFLIPGSF